jgi:hypothetical protein
MKGIEPSSYVGDNHEMIGVVVVVATCDLLLRFICQLVKLVLERLQLREKPVERIKPK